MDVTVEFSKVLSQICDLYSVLLQRSVLNEKPRTRHLGMIKEPDMISFQKKPGKPSLTRQPNFVAE